jgi:outer membrane protein assembly factor BamE (lipoprotein component of BamABCDE complex)
MKNRKLRKFMEVIMKKMILSLLCLMIVGCYSMGNKQIMDSSKTSQIQEGKTTKEEVRGSLGEPNHAQPMPNGEEMWMYTYSQSTTRPTTFIPLVGLFAGGMDTKSKSINLLFDANGVLKSYGGGQYKGGGGSVFD